MNHFSDSNELMADISKIVPSSTMIDEIKVLNFRLEFLLLKLTISPLE
jgi:hypothetical protein